MEVSLETFYDRNVGKALERLIELRPYQSILFVGSQHLVEVLIDEAKRFGLKVSSLPQQNSQFLLTLLARFQKEPEKAESAPEVAPVHGWFRVTFVSLLRFIRGSSL